MASGMTGGDRPVVGVLHPGRMGAGIAGEARANAAEVLWCPAGRSQTTADRAAEAGLVAVDSVAELVERSDVILSICPPAFAIDVATELGTHDLTGRIVVEANPTTTAQLAEIADLIPAATLVDGAIIGSVVGSGKLLELYTSGPPAALATLDQLFAGTQVTARPIGSELGRASALKLAYSTFQKGSCVLAALANALADDHGVQPELLALAEQRRGSYLAEPDYVAETAALAWRWAPELKASASQLNSQRLPGAAVEALADALDGWKGQRDSQLTPERAVESWRRDPSRDGDYVSFETTAHHYGIHRWTLERDATSHLVGLLQVINASPLNTAGKTFLANIAFAQCHLENALLALNGNVNRISLWYADPESKGPGIKGVPALLSFLSGPHGTNSLEYIVAISLWSDLKTVLTAYRTVRDQVDFLRRNREKGRYPVSNDFLRNHDERLKQRTLTEFENKRIVELANTVLHRSWHPSAPNHEASLSLYWNDGELRREPRFTAEGDVVDSLYSHVQSARLQIREIVLECSAAQADRTDTKSP